MVRFIHAADLHLDSPFKGLNDVPENYRNKILDSTFQSLRNIVYLAVHKQVDFVLFAGDIFDIEDRSVKAQVTFKREMERLLEENIAVYLIHGNHDSIANKSAFLDFPQNVYVFDEEVETVEYKTASNEIISITGFSYNERHIYERMIKNYPRKNSASDYHIGLLHGSLEGASTVHGQYAPFSISEIKQLHYDYFALGHIHLRQQLHPSIPAYYSGNTQGRHRNETGNKGCYLIESHENRLIPKFVETASINWENLFIDVSEKRELNSIFQKIEEEINKLEIKDYLISIDLTISKDLPNSIISKLSTENLNHGFATTDDSHFLWITRVKYSYIEDQNKVISLETMFPKAWEMAIQDIEDDQTFEQLFDELYNQVPPNYLEELQTVEFQNKVIEDAMKTLNHLMDS